MVTSSSGLEANQNDLQDCWKLPVSNVLVSVGVNPKGLQKHLGQDATQEVVLKSLRN